MYSSVALSTFTLWCYDRPSPELPVSANSIIALLVTQTEWQSSCLVCLSLVHVFLLWQNIRNMKFTILTTIKCTVQWHWVHSHCGAMIVHLQNFLSSPTETLSPLNTNPPSPPPSHSTHPYTFCLYECDYSRCLTHVESHSTCHFVTGLFHWA